MVMSWQAQMSPHVSMCAKGAERPPQGSWCSYPHTAPSARGGSILLASYLHMVSTRCIGWLPDRLWRGSGAPHMAPHTAVLCFSPFGSPSGPSELSKLGRARPHGARTRAGSLERAVGGWAEAGVVQEAAVHLRLQAEHCFSTTDSAQAYCGTCHLPVALSLVWPLSLVYSVPRL